MSVQTQDTPVEGVHIGPWTMIPGRGYAPESAAVADQIDLDGLLRMRRLSDEDRTVLVEHALGLCNDCRVRLRTWLSRGYNLVSALRETLWEWFGTWMHGRGCPPEQPTQ